MLSVIARAMRASLVVALVSLTVLWGEASASTAPEPTPFDHGGCCTIDPAEGLLPALRISVNAFGIHITGDGFDPSTPLTVRFVYMPFSQVDGRAGSQSGLTSDSAGQLTTTLPLRLITERPGLFSVSVDGTAAQGALWILF